ncbi:flagellar basal body L-ring protein FlgH [Sphingomonas koreensis]|uniref:flagellar basal body L-ring protein FlgH n=1 Tax=Sphingomonas koreensis TaxID=93064 RepID=UPI00082CB1EB|nr:flagellar basal body L-ring protein FlgH [Sphingomonas koreensis]PJI87901.1 flagellar L-ring protein precursor FlgH [Sphingomonas koreensis]RSU58343.1 flagellar basal body L-ring protein FlgH [Sphingomonas koreensis]RSU71945.1 flagellar basal body L-ring protein FlgH [Sphingomonas koreensis]
MKYVLPAILAASMLSGCGAVGRLKAIGKPPRMSEAEAPVAPRVEPSIGNAAAQGRGGSASLAETAPGGASLFRTGAGAFFRDQRASRVGDIVTIRINIADNARVDNATTRTRAGSESGGIAALLGLESQIGKILPGNPDPSKLVDTSSDSRATGAGNTSRSEQINMTVAALIMDVLPNGNLMIRGRQEVRVNFELRELVVTGVIRPEDIARDNSIRHSQIADARISYGGRGQLTDAQQARWGQQIYDALFPF